MGLIVLFANWNILNDGKHIVTKILFICLILSFILIYFPFKKIPIGDNFISSKIKDILFAFSKIRKSYKTLIVLSIYPSLHLILMGVSYWITFNACGYKLDLLSGVLFSIITNLLLFIKITPQNVGIREIFIGFVSVLAGTTFSTGVLASAIIRVAGLVMHLIIGVPCLISLNIKKEP